MSQSKVYGFLNNCALGTGVPELLDAFRYFARKENPDAKISVNAALDGCAKAYEQLKKSFEECYQLEKFSWKALVELLTTKVNHNSAAAQAMLGPALRVYMSKIGFDKNKCELQSDGRFATLFSTDAKKVFENFGINVRSYEVNPDPRFTGSPYRYLEESPRTIKNEVYKINIFNEGSNHWERLPKAEMATAINGANTLEGDAKSISDAFFAGSLAMLKAAVQAIVPGLIKTAAPKVEVPKVITEDKIIDKFAEDAVKSYSASLKKRKIEEKPGDATSKKENVRKLMTDLFAVDYTAKTAAVVRSASESDKEFEKRQQIAVDEELARKLQGEEVKAARGMKF